MLTADTEGAPGVWLQDVPDSDEDDHYNIDGVTIAMMTIKLHLEHHIVGTRTCAASFFPDAALGTPCTVRVADPDYTITEVRFAPAADPARLGSDQAGAVAEGRFCPGRIEYDVAGGENDFWW